MFDNEYRQTYYSGAELTEEAIILDSTVKAVIEDFTTITDKLNININKDEELVNTWSLTVQKFDTIVKTLQNNRWAKVVTYSTGLLFLGTFLWKMGALRAVPNFAGNLLSSIPRPSISSTQTLVKETTPPDNTVQHIMETP